MFHSPSSTLHVVEQNASAFRGGHGVAEGAELGLFDGYPAGRSVVILSVGEREGITVSNDVIFVEGNNVGCGDGENVTNSAIGSMVGVIVGVEVGMSTPTENVHCHTSINILDECAPNRGRVIAQIANIQSTHHK